jgi:dTDP-4-amino-4,6-dideoxygalactose transaminase
VTASDATGNWIRLRPRASRATASAEDVAALDGRLWDVFGCRAFWWVPDARKAWEAVLRALAAGSGRQVLIPAGAAEHVESAAAACRAALVEVDLHPHSAAPDWASVPASCLEGPGVLVLDHRFGLPSGPPAATRGLVVIEDATGAAGSAIDGKPVGSLGVAAIVELGAPPFTPSPGALVLTASAQAQEQLAACLAPPALPDDVRAQLAAGIRDLPDWVEGCRAAARAYDSAWRPLDLPLETLHPPAGTLPTASAYIVLAHDPDGLVEALAREGIEAARPLNPRLDHLLREPARGRLDGARRLYRRAVRLPNHPDLELGEVLYVADVVRRHLAAARS